VAHARQLLASEYGDAVSDWEVRLSEAPPGFRVWRARFMWRCSRSARGLRETTGQTALSTNRNSWPHTTAGAIGCHLPEPGSLRWTRAPWPRHGLGQAVGIVFTVLRIGVDWTRELKRLQTFDDLASVSPDEGQVFVDAPQAWRAVAGAAAQDLQWLEEEAGELTTPATAGTRAEVGGMKAPAVQTRLRRPPRADHASGRVAVSRGHRSRHRDLSRVSRCGGA